MIEKYRRERNEPGYRSKKLHITDCETYQIAVRLGRRPKYVEMYDARRLAEFENHQEALGFMGLWDALHKDAPHGKVPIAHGRPRKWWQIWR